MRSPLPRRLLLLVGAMALGAVLLLGGVAYARQCEREVPAVDAPPPSVLIVMDASRSMSKPAGDGRTRLDAAKAALRKLVAGLPDATRVGLRLYGHRVSGTTRAEGCRDTELVAPVGELDRRALAGQIASYRAVGSTPIGRSLREAAGDLPQDGVTSIVLVSDGGDNCAPPSPCAVAGQIAGRGTDLSVQAIGFQVTGRARAQLRCIAERGRGVYRDAADADELAVALRALAARGTRTFTVAGTPVSGGGTERDATPIASGRLLDRIGPGDERWYRVELGRGQRIAASGTLIVACPPKASVRDSIGTTFEIEVRAPGSVTPDALDATTNLFADDISVESVGLLTAPNPRAATAATRREHLLRVALEADPDGGLARALGAPAVPLQLDVDVIGRGEDAAAAAASSAGGLDVVVAIAVIVGCLLIGAIAGATVAAPLAGCVVTKSPRRRALPAPRRLAASRVAARRVAARWEAARWAAARWVAARRVAACRGDRRADRARDRRRADGRGRRAPRGDESCLRWWRLRRCAVAGRRDPHGHAAATRNAVLRRRAARRPAAAGPRQGRRQRRKPGRAGHPGRV